MRYEIPEVNMESLMKKLVRISNKCKKYGCEFKLEIGEKFIKEFVVEYIDAFGVEKRERFHAAVFPVDVEGTAIVSGWKFVASLEWTEKGNIIKGIGGIEVPARYYDCEPKCEHCKTDRFRKYTFIVQNVETGEFKQVGKSCLKDFTGGLSAEHVANFESYFRELEDASDIHDSLGRNDRYYDVKKFACVVAETIRHYGYHKSEDCDLCTWKMALWFFYHVSKWELEGEAGKWVKEQFASHDFNVEREESVKLAETVLDWIAKNEIDTNYIHNLKVACSLEYTTVRNLGLIASAFPAFDRNLEYQAEQKKKAKEGAISKHVGSIGEKIQFVIKFADVITSWETMYGMTYVNKILDEEGNVFTWKTSYGLGEDDIGKKIKGTVKEFKEFRGVKQTELTRCRMEKTVQPTQPENKVVERKYEGSCQEGFDLLMRYFETDDPSVFDMSRRRSFPVPEGYV